MPGFIFHWYSPPFLWWHIHVLYGFCMSVHHLWVKSPGPEALPLVVRKNENRIKPAFFWHSVKDDGIKVMKIKCFDFMLQKSKSKNDWVDRKLGGPTKCFHRNNNWKYVKIDSEKNMRKNMYASNFLYAGNCLCSSVTHVVHTAAYCYIMVCVPYNGFTLCSLFKGAICHTHLHRLQGKQLLLCTALVVTRAPCVCSSPAPCLLAAWSC